MVTLVKQTPYLRVGYNLTNWLNRGLLYKTVLEFTWTRCVLSKHSTPHFLHHNLLEMKRASVLPHPSNAYKWSRTRPEFILIGLGSVTLSGVVIALLLTKTGTISHWQLRVTNMWKHMTLVSRHSYLPDWQQHQFKPNLSSCSPNYLWEYISTCHYCSMITDPIKYDSQLNYKYVK